MPVTITEPKKSTLPPSDYVSTCWALPVLDSLNKEYPDLAPKVNVRTPAMKWRLASATQKAFRRREANIETFLAGLHFVDPNYAWRRFATIVMEDAGTVLAGSAWHAEVYAVMLYLAGGKKRRQDAGVDDLNDLIRFARRFQQIGRDRSVCNMVVATEVFGLLKECADTLKGKAWTAYTEHDNGLWKIAAAASAATAAQPLLATEAVMPPGFGPSIAYIAAEGVRQKLGGMFSAFPLAVLKMHGVTTSIDEQPPESVMIGAYPSYAFDQYTSDGKRALRYFMAMKKSPFIAWLDDKIADKDARYDLLRKIMFKAESGILSQRRTRITAPGIEKSFDRIMHDLAFYPVTNGKFGLADSQADEGVLRFQESIGDLNYARKKVIEP